MCNAYEQHVAWEAYTRMMQALELGIPTQQNEFDLKQAADVRINDLAPIMRATGNDKEVELTPANFGLPCWKRHSRRPRTFDCCVARAFGKLNRLAVPRRLCRMCHSIALQRLAEGDTVAHSPAHEHLYFTSAAARY
jgi:hypothetical protein